MDKSDKFNSTNLIRLGLFLLIVADPGSKQINSFLSLARSQVVPYELCGLDYAHAHSARACMMSKLVCIWHSDLAQY